MAAPRRAGDPETSPTSRATASGSTSSSGASARRAQRLPLLRRAQRALDRSAAARLLHLLHPALRSAVLQGRAQADEVFFRLKHRDDDLRPCAQALRRRARAGATASGSNKKIYDDKALEHLRTLTRWLQREADHRLRGHVPGQAPEASASCSRRQARAPSRGGVRDYVDVAAAVSVAPTSTDTSARLPVFDTPITRENRGAGGAGRSALDRGSVKSKLGAAVLDALECSTATSFDRGVPLREARLEQLGAKGEGQVLNRSELVRSSRGRVLDPLPPRARVPRRGPGGTGPQRRRGPEHHRQEARRGAIDQFAKLSVNDLAQFKHIERPRDLPLGPLQELFDLLGVPKGLIVNPAKRDEAVTQLQAEVASWSTSRARPRPRRRRHRVLGQARSSRSRSSRVAAAPRRPEALPRVAPGLQHRGQAQELPARVAAIQAQRPGSRWSARSKSSASLSSRWVPRPPTWARPRRCSSRPPLGRPDAGRRGELMAKITSPKHRADSSGLPARTSARPWRELKTAYQDAYLSSLTPSPPPSSTLCRRP
jgi:hypothetical protein